MYAVGADHAYRRPCLDALERILSTDAHFDQVAEVQRIDPRDFAA